MCRTLNGSFLSILLNSCPVFQIGPRTLGLQWHRMPVLGIFTATYAKIGDSHSHLRQVFAAHIVEVI